MTLPALRQVRVSDLRPEDVPTQMIRTEEDVIFWKSTQGYRDLGLFLRRLNESVVGHFLPWSGPSPSEAVQSTIALLEKLDRFIDDIPPLPTPQRFGNLAFRTWGRRLEEEAPSLMSDLLPTNLHHAIPFISPYFMTSFGSFTRMDYGTGHETSFAVFLLCLTLLRFFEPDPQIERELVLCVFVRYLRLCWRLQDVYKLEPAGSHGVWGLDDSSFLGYIFGSGQLRDQTEIPVSAVLHPPLAPTNLYFMLIMRIHEVKHGPFHEHSSQLYAIATGVASWAKVNSGLFKMYEAEVLGKRVVVQHLPLGGLMSWETDGHSQPQNTAYVSDSTFGTSMGPGAAPTRAPWASSAIPATAPYPSSQNHPHASHGLATARPGASQYTPGRFTGGILPARAPLGPTASTRLRTQPEGSHVHPAQMSDPQQSLPPPHPPVEDPK